MLRQVDTAVTERERGLDAAATLALRALVAVALFWVAYDGGAYALPDRNALAIEVWWLAALAIALGL